MNKYLLSLIAVLVAIVAVSTFGASVINVADASNGLTGQITSNGTPGGVATAWAQNNSSSDKRVTFTSYKMFVYQGAPGWLDTQVVFDYETLTVAPGQTVNFSINLPDCKYQLDVYEGEVQYHLSDDIGGFAGQNLLAWFISEANVCTNNPPAACVVPTGLNPTGTVNGNSVTLSWNPVPEAVYYNIRLDDGTSARFDDSRFETCANSPHYYCENHVTVTQVTNVPVTPGKTYSFWVDPQFEPGRNYCNGITSFNVPLPPQNTLACNPQDQSVLVNGTANFSATGGDGTYSWSTNIGSDAGNPANGTGATFATAYSTSGYKTVTVSSGSQIATCHVTVNEIPQQTLSCNPQNQSVYINSSANFTATGGNGTYSWSGGESPSTGSGSSFSTSYSSVGARTVTVTSGSQTATCNVIVNTQPQQTLSCNPQSQSGYVGSYLSFNATGGNGTYSWSGGESPSTGSGSNFSTQFNSVGFRTVVVTSGSQTATCNVTINQQQQNSLTCGPQNQSANVNDVVNFYANGGNGTYSWNAYDAQITYGNNQNFSTRFNSAGSKSVTVSSNGQTATCYVNVNTVFGSNTYFQITKNVLNKTLNQNSYVNFVEAQSNDLLEFEIRVRNTGNTNAEVNLKDILPSDLNYVYGSATMNGYYLNDSLINYNGVSLGNVYPGEEKIIRLRAAVRPNAPAVTVTNQAVATMNSNTQNAFATIQLRNRGQVLGAADIVTGPEDVMPWVLSLGFITSLVVYFYFFYSRPERRKVSLAVVTVSDSNSGSSNEEAGVFKAVRPKKELDALISEFKKREASPDI